MESILFLSHSISLLYFSLFTISNLEGSMFRKRFKPDLFQLRLLSKVFTAGILQNNFQYDFLENLLIFQSYLQTYLIEYCILTLDCDQQVQLHIYFSKILASSRWRTRLASFSCLQFESTRSLHIFVLEFFSWERRKIEQPNLKSSEQKLIAALKCLPELIQCQYF